MVVGGIDRDYINTEAGTSFNRVGKTFEVTDEGAAELATTMQPVNTFERTRFRCKDDDGEIYYGGWLYNDTECEVQLEILRWCQNDAGCTTIEIKKDGEWVQEIG